MTTAVSVVVQAKVGKKRPGLEQQREVILHAAVDLFSVRGVKAVSVSDICKNAKVSRDTYYRCFADKDALISHLYQTSVNDHIETVLGTWDLNYGDQKWLHQAFDKTIDAILRQHKVAQFLFVESSDPSSHAYRVIHKAYGKVAKRMQRWCKENHGNVPSTEFLIALLVSTQWLVHNAIITGMGKRDINKAKVAAEQLFYAAFSSLSD
ncbi:MAG: TetR/AcrR family transcriptional regulator [Pseudomonadales bacterium]